MQANTERNAAERLLELRRPGEKDVELARRIGLTSQHITNYKRGEGVGLAVLARLAERLPQRDVMYVLSGKRGRPTNDYVAGIRDAIAAGVKSLAELENQLSAGVTACPPREGDGRGRRAEDVEVEEVTPRRDLPTKRPTRRRAKPRRSE